MAEKIKPEIIGEIGEGLAVDLLASMGYQLVRFDKGMMKKESRKLGSLPIVPDYGVGYSYGRFGLDCYTNLHGAWGDSVIPSWADISLDKIKRCAKQCRAESECGIRDRNPKTAPCSKIDSILSKNWLASITPECNGLSIEENGQLVKRTGMVVVGECLRRFRAMIRNEYKSQFLHDRDFILFNQLISEYIQIAWAEWSRIHPLPHSGQKILELSKRPGSDELVEKLKQENRAALKKLPAGHPGRYDLIGQLGSDLFAIEVKTNTSKLNYWQTLRFALLQRFGYKTILVKVTIPTDALQEAVAGAQKFSNTIDVIDNPAIDASVETPSIEQFNKLLAIKSGQDDPYPIFY